MKHASVLSMAAMSMAILFTLPSEAARRPAAPSGLQHAVTTQLDVARGVLVIQVELRNTGFPSIDMSGQARLEIDGAVADQKALGLDDRVILRGEIPLDGAAHQACVRFDGQQAQQTRKGLATSPVSYLKCQQVAVP